MPNYKQAPKLYHNKSHFYDKNFYQLPQDLMDCVFQQLDGKCGNQIKLMVVLLGTLGNGSFGVSEKWICDRTGMNQPCYNRARKALVEKGWIYLEDGMLFVLPSIIRFGFPYPDGVTDAEKEAIKIATISNCVNEIKQTYNIKKQTYHDDMAIAQEREGLEKQTYHDDMGKAYHDNMAKAYHDNMYNKEIINNEINNNRIGISSPIGADSPIPLFINPEVKIEGEISPEEASAIIDKQVIAPSLILTSTGKYFRVKENAKS